MSQKSLEDRLQAAGGPLKMLRESQTGPYVYPVVPPEYSNWRDEQRAWRETCILFNQSFHMTDMYVEGPDAPRLLEHLGVNTSATSSSSTSNRTGSTSSAAPRYTTGCSTTPRPASTT